MSDDFKVGEFITCGRSGWWRVKSPDPMSKNRIIVELVMDSKGNIPQKKGRSFSAFKQWCHKINTDTINKIKQQDIKKWDTLLFIMDPSLDTKDESIAKKLENLGRPEPDYLVNIGPPPRLIKK